MLKWVWYMDNVDKACKGNTNLKEGPFMYFIHVQIELISILVKHHLSHGSQDNVFRNSKRFLQGVIRSQAPQFP